MSRNILNTDYSNVSSNGILTPELSTTTRNAFLPTNGQLIFNSTTGTLQMYSSDDWGDIPVSNVAISNLTIGNIRLSGNTVSSTNTNGAINLTPNGTGSVVVSSPLSTSNWTISGNSITNNTFGNVLTATDTGLSSVTSYISETGFIARDTLNTLDTAVTPSGFLYSQKDVTITSLKTNGNITLTPSGTGSVILSKALNVNSNAISGVTNLTMSGTLSGATSISATSVSATTVTATNLGGTLTTPTQTNITRIGTQAAALNMGSNKITSLGEPTLTGDAATKNYVDTLANAKANLSGATFVGPIAMSTQDISGIATLTANKLNISQNPQIIRRKSAQQSIPHNTLTGITWDTATNNTGITYSETSSDPRFTVNITGNYMIYYTINSIAGTNQMESWVQVNETIGNPAFRHGWSSGSARMTVNCTISLTTNDVLRLVVYQSTVSPLNIPQVNNSTNNNMNLHIQRINSQSG